MSSTSRWLASLSCWLCPTSSISSMRVLQVQRMPGPFPQACGLLLRPGVQVLLVQRGIRVHTRVLLAHRRGLVGALARRGCWAVRCPARLAGALPACVRASSRCSPRGPSRGLRAARHAAVACPAQFGRGCWRGLPTRRASSLWFHPRLVRACAMRSPMSAFRSINSSSFVIERIYKYHSVLSINPLTKYPSVIILYDSSDRTKAIGNDPSKVHQPPPTPTP